MKLLIIVVGVMLLIFGFPVLIALGPLWIIALAGFGLLWAYSALFGDH